jgi:hypothetical protein
MHNTICQTKIEKEEEKSRKIGGKQGKLVKMEHIPWGS